MSIIRKIITGKDYCAVTEDGYLVEYVRYDPADQCGNIILGKVERLMPGMQCAFVDIGRKKSGFLPMEEKSNSFKGTPLRCGELCILQIRREETECKGAFLTRDVTIPGQYVILMPMNHYIGVSSRIEDETKREQLRKTGMEIADNCFGLVMRSAAAGADSQDIRHETEMLLALWLEIYEKASKGGRPGMILRTEEPSNKIMEDYAAGGYERISHDQEPSQDILRQLREAGDRTLRLPSGGNIVIDRCEAMTVIDVNTGSSAGKGSKERTVTETNIEACSLIARQVRLRNLNGIILIDFVDMEEETDRSLVMEKLLDCFKPDRVKTVIHGWTKLGIMEMTRKHTGNALKTEGY